MSSRALPAAFPHLWRRPNKAVDEVLVEALPELGAFAQAVAIEVLAKRADPEALKTVVGRFLEYQGVLQGLVEAQATILSTGVRGAMTSGSRSSRLAAIELLARSDAAELAYLLSDALGSSCRETRSHAGAALRRLTERLLVPVADPDDSGREPAHQRQLEHLTRTLGAALRRWEKHHESAVLDPVLWLIEPLRDELCENLGHSETSLAIAIGARLRGTSDTRMSRAVLWALTIESIRASAIRAIVHADSEPFVRALVCDAVLRTDPVLVKNLRRIEIGPWVERFVAAIDELDETTVGSAVVFVFGLGGSPAERMMHLRSLVEADSRVIRNAVVQELSRDRSESSTDLLRLVAMRRGDELSSIAAEEVRRRGSSPSAPACARHGHPDDPAVQRLEQAFTGYWDAALDPADSRTRLIEVLSQTSSDVVAKFFDARLALDEPLDRARALRIVRLIELTPELSQRLSRSASDPNSVVRSLAVANLALMPGALSERLLRVAIHDSDVRVQANAIEALDRLDVADRVALTVPKLTASNSRVRATAVKSLLRSDVARAATALTEMLQDESPAQRLSGLWVIERMHSVSLLAFVEKLAKRDSDPRVRRRALRMMHVLSEHASAGAEAVSAGLSEDGQTR